MSSLFQVEKAVSIALKIGAASNLKFLKLLPGPMSGGRASDICLVDWLSVTIVLFPVELFFAFHTVNPCGEKTSELVSKTTHAVKTPVIYTKDH